MPSAFSDNADFVNIRGEAFRGREAISQLYARILGAKFKGNHATITIRHVAELAPYVAMIEPITR